MKLSINFDIFFQKLKVYVINFGTFTNHILLIKTTARSIHRRCSIKTALLKNFAIFTGKHLCCSLSKVAGVKVLRTTILKNICEQLFLRRISYHYHLWSKWWSWLKYMQIYIFFYINQFTLWKLQMQITCLRLKMYGIKPQIEFKLK